jgi:hypothetical protein
VRVRVRSAGAERALPPLVLTRVPRFRFTSRVTRAPGRGRCCPPANGRTEGRARATIGTSGWPRRGRLSEIVLGIRFVVAIRITSYLRRGLPDSPHTAFDQGFYRKAGTREMAGQGDIHTISTPSPAALYPIRRCRCRHPERHLLPLLWSLLRDWHRHPLLYRLLTWCRERREHQHQMPRQRRHRRHLRWPHRGRTDCPSCQPRRALPCLPCCHHLSGEVEG